MRRSTRPSLLAAAIRRIAPPLSFGGARARLAVPDPIIPPASPATDREPLLAALLAAGLGVPQDARPVRFGALYRDAAPADGDTVHAIATWQVPQGYVFRARQRVVLLSTDGDDVTGGVALLVGGVNEYDGNAGAPGTTFGDDCIPSEWLGSSGSDAEYPRDYPAMTELQLVARLARGGTPVTCKVMAHITGYLIRNA